MKPKLSPSDRVVVIDVGEKSTALTLAQTGVPVLVVGLDAVAVGELVRAIGASGGRALAFVGEPRSTPAAVVAMTAELFPDN